MQRTLLLGCLALVLAAADPPPIPAAIAAKAAAIAPAAAPRPERIAALHAFVRDAIAEVPTKYS